MYNKPVLNNHLDNTVPSMLRMQKKLAQHGYDIIPLKKENGKFVADVYQNGNWIKEGNLEYENKDVCVYNTLVIIYKRIIKQEHGN